MSDINVIQTGKQTADKLINITSYELVRKVANPGRFSVIICDESHALKDGKVERTKSTMAFLKCARRIFLLSGTPALSRPKELWNQINALSTLFSNFFEFGIRYCGGKQGNFGWDFTGATNLDELHLLLRHTVMIRRLKENVLKDLPEKNRSRVQIQTKFVMPSLFFS